MKQFNTLALAVFIAVSGAALAADVMLGIGHTRIVRIPGLTTESMVDYSGPLEVTELGDGWLKVRGRDVGAGTIEAETPQGTQEFTVEVVTADPDDVAEQLEVLFGDIEAELDIDVVRGRVFVSGTIMTQADKLRFDKAMAMYPDVVNLVRVEAKELMVSVSAVLIEVENSSGHGAVVLDGEHLPLDAHFGYEWAKQGTYFEDPANRRLSWGVGLNEYVLRTIRGMIEKGKARVIARPSVVTINGQKASLLSGGERPYTSGSYWGVATTRFKPYGIRLDVVPELLPSGEVMMDIEVESSQPYENGIAARRATVKAAVDKGQSLLLAGLSTVSYRRGHGFGCFFPLFKSDAAFLQKELLVVVTPNAPSVLGFDQFEIIKEEDLEK